MKTTHYYIYARVRFVLAVLAASFLCSCSHDYRHAIPKGSTALLALDADGLLQESGEEAAASISKMLGVDDLAATGIDFGETLYGFETADGTLGVVLPVADEDDLDDWLAALESQGKAMKISEKKGYPFTVLNGSIVLGHSASALVAVGPVVASEQAEVQRRVAKWLDADGEGSIKDTRLYGKLQSLTGPVRLVGRSDALPEQLAAALTLGTPKGTSAKEVYVALDVKPTDKGYTLLEGGSFSFDEKVDAALNEARKAYKPIRGTLLGGVSPAALVTMACGVEGDSYLQMLRSSEAMRTLLFGANTVLDIDKMLRSVSGDLVACLKRLDGESPVFSLEAEQHTTDWLADVGYWKRSCPIGTSIADGDAPDTYRLRSKAYNLDFGINAQKRLYIASAVTSAPDDDKPAKPLPDEIRKVIEGKRLALVVNVAALAGAEPLAAPLLPLAGALAGKDGMIVYTIE